MGRLLVMIFVSTVLYESMVHKKMLFSKGSHLPMLSDTLAFRSTLAELCSRVGCFYGAEIPSCICRCDKQSFSFQTF
eukprot:4659083-Amphidinium_carterae.1